MSMTLEAVIWDADDPCSVYNAYAPESFFTMSPQSTTLPLYFWYRSSNSEFLRWQRSINDAKWTFLPLFLASSITSFLFRTFVSHAWIFFSFPHSSPLPPLHLEFFNACKIVMIQRIHPFFSDMILVMFLYCSFQPRSRAFVGINKHKHILSCVFQHCGGFHHCSLSVFCKALLLHRNFQLSTSGFDCELEFFIVLFN